MPYRTSAVVEIEVVDKPRVPKEIIDDLITALAGKDIEATGNEGIRSNLSSKWEISCKSVVLGAVPHGELYQVDMTINRIRIALSFWQKRRIRKLITTKAKEHMTRAEVLCLETALDEVRKAR